MQNHHRNCNHEARFRRHERFGNTASEHAGIVSANLGNHGKERNDTRHRTEKPEQRSDRSHRGKETHTAFQFRLFAEQRLLQGAFRIFTLFAGAVQHGEQHHRKARLFFEAKVGSVFVTRLFHQAVQLLDKAAAQVPAVSEHQEAFQAKQQGKDCHQCERVHHNTALLEESLEFFLQGEFLRFGNRVLDGLVLQNVQRDFHLGAGRSLLHRGLHVHRHLGRERRIPFKDLSLQGARA